MVHLIPLSRLARLVGQPRSQLQRMAQQGEMATFDGHVALEEVLRLFPDVRMEDDAEIRRVEAIKDAAVSKGAAAHSLPDAEVLHERLRVLGRDYARARAQVLHHDRVHGWIAGKLDEARETGDISTGFAEGFLAWLRRELAAPPEELGRWQELLARERIMRVMTAQVKVLPKGQTFEIAGSETILEAGLRAGLALPYGCSNGSCGDCKCRVADGEVVKVRPHDYVLSSAEKAQGYVLSCSYTAVRDLAIEVPLWGVGDIPEQTIKARVRAVEPLGGRRIALHLLTPRAERLRYMAGQALEITIDGHSRMAPAASCPCEERRIEVHMLCEADPLAAPGTFAGVAVNAEVTVRGPFGTFVLDDSSMRPVLLLAAGPGFGPVKSLLQHALSLEHAPQITLHRFADEEGLYQENLLKSYAAALEHFRYVPHAAGVDRDLAIDDILGVMPGITGYDIYAAGDAAFVASVAARAKEFGVVAQQVRTMAVT
jgi:CDP-4-dehydro-6-deoxyglucose reductase